MAQGSLARLHAGDQGLSSGDRGRGSWVSSLFGVVCIGSLPDTLPGSVDEAPQAANRALWPEMHPYRPVFFTGPQLVSSTSTHLRWGPGGESHVWVSGSITNRVGTGGPPASSAAGLEGLLASAGAALKEASRPGL